MSAPSQLRRNDHFQQAESTLVEEIRSAMAEILQFTTATVEIVDAAALDGRVKVAVRSSNPQRSAVSDCVGVGGRYASELEARLSARVEFVEFDPNPSRYVAAALDVEVVSVRVEAASSGPKAVVVVSSEVYPFAVGRRGINARLSSALTGYWVSICTPACSAATHHHPVGVVPDTARGRQKGRRQSQPSLAERAPFALPPMPPHVREARANRRRRTPR